MNWKFEGLVQEHQLIFGKSILARIQYGPTRKGKYFVTTLISGIYYSAHTQKKLEQEKKEWVAYRKKFKDKATAMTYINRKKDEVTRFITAREKEA